MFFITCDFNLGMTKIWLQTKVKLACAHMSKNKQCAQKWLQVISVPNIGSTWHVPIWPEEVCTKLDWSGTVWCGLFACYQSMGAASHVVILGYILCQASHGRWLARYVKQFWFSVLPGVLHFINYHACIPGGFCTKIAWNMLLARSFGNDLLICHGIWPFEATCTIFQVILCTRCYITIYGCCVACRDSRVHIVSSIARPLAGKVCQAVLVQGTSGRSAMYKLSFEHPGIILCKHCLKYVAGTFFRQRFAYLPRYLAFRSDLHNISS